MATDKPLPIRYHFYALKFTAYNGQEKKNTTKSIIIDIANFLTKQKEQNKGYLIDRHEKRSIDGPRELFMSHWLISYPDNKIRFTLALLRSGRPPMLKPKESFALVPFDINSGDIVERTHFYVDFSKNYCVVCAEFNNNGPRAADFEYYLRHIAKDELSLAKVTEMTLYMDTSLDKALADLKNILDIDIKVQPEKLAKLDTVLVGQYFTGITSIAQKIKPKFIKIQALFQTPGKNIQSKELNKGAVKMVTDFLNSFKQKPVNLDCFENFVVKYEDRDGNEEVLNLLKGKKEIVKEVDLSIGRNERQWYEIIGSDFDDFIRTL